MTLPRVIEGTRLPPWPPSYPVTWRGDQYLTGLTEHRQPLPSLRVHSWVCPAAPVPAVPAAVAAAPAAVLSPPPPAAGAARDPVRGSTGGGGAFRAASVHARLGRTPQAIALPAGRFVSRAAIAQSPAAAAADAAAAAAAAAVAAFTFDCDVTPTATCPLGTLSFPAPPAPPDTPATPHSGSCLAGARIWLLAPPRRVGAGGVAIPAAATAPVAVLVPAESGLLYFQGGAVLARVPMKVVAQSGGGGGGGGGGAAEVAAKVTIAAVGTGGSSGDGGGGGGGGGAPAAAASAAPAAGRLSTTPPGTSEHPEAKAAGGDVGGRGHSFSQARGLAEAALHGADENGQEGADEEHVHEVLPIQLNRHADRRLV